MHHETAVEQARTERQAAHQKWLSVANAAADLEIIYHTKRDSSEYSWEETAGTHANWVTVAERAHRLEAIYDAKCYALAEAERVQSETIELVSKMVDAFGPTLTAAACGLRQRTLIQKIIDGESDCPPLALRKLQFMDRLFSRLCQEMDSDTARMWLISRGNYLLRLREPADENTLDSETQRISAAAEEFIRNG